MVYGIARRGMGLHMVWLGRMTCIWYGLAGMAWYMVWPGGHRMVYRIGMVWSVGNDIVYRNGLAR